MSKRTKKSIIADLEYAEWELEHLEYFKIPKLKKELSQFKLTKREIKEFDMEEYVTQQQPKQNSMTTLEINFISDNEVEHKRWINKEDWDFMVQFRNDKHAAWMKKHRRAVSKVLNNVVDNIEASKDVYFVNLSNSDDTKHTLGLKSRITGQIWLLKDNYDVDLSKPIEETDFHFVRNSTLMDI